MKQLIDLKRFCLALSISSSTYYEMRKPESDKYDPDMPKAIKAFGDNKLRFDSEEVEAYINILIVRANKIAA